jgi:hypothetical protein
MRRFKNISKSENEQLSKVFVSLLKFSDECDPTEAKWVAVTVFDHWLHESDSFNIIKNASDKQREQWSLKMASFLRKLVEMEEPICYKTIGKLSKQKLQFRKYIGVKPISDYLIQLEAETYSPEMVFKEHKFYIFFEDYWTIHIIYKDISLLKDVFKIAAEINLYFLPDNSAGHLNKYDEVKEAVQKAGYSQTLQRKISESSS